MFLLFFPIFQIKHVPFVLSVTLDGWYAENGSTNSTFIEEGIDHVIHSIMHCE